MFVKSHGPRRRIFIALNVPEEAKVELARVVQELQKKNLPVIWQDPQKAHITLLFLGHIATERLGAAVNAIKAMAKLQIPFKLRTGQQEYFYSDTENNSVLFVSVKDQNHDLRNLYKELATVLGKEDFSPPTRLHPHITIGRLKKQKDRNKQTEMLLSLIEEPIEEKTIPVESIGILESFPDKGTSIPGKTSKTRYRLLYNIPLL